MKISTEINSAAKRIGEEKTIEYVAKAGFDAWDFSMFAMANYDWQNKCLKPTEHPLAGKDYLKFARKLKQIGNDNGIVCNQAHAPFPVYNAEIRSMMKRAIECAAEAEAEICVVHPDNFKSAEENAEMFLELLPFAKACGVKIATENMWSWDKETDRAIFSACATAEDFCAHLDVINDPYFVACLDLGHAEMMGDMANAPDMIRALGSRLQALHIHDNDLWHDSHQLPFTMQMDFDAIVRALKEIEYSGDFTLEADRYLDDFAEGDIFKGIQNMAQTARKLTKMFENA